jgi:hypothetical protein
MDLTRLTVRTLSEFDWHRTEFGGGQVLAMLNVLPEHEEEGDLASPMHLTHYIFPYTSIKDKYE